jgi:hypothetical protein
MIHLIHNTTKHRYNSAMFDILGGQPEELTYLQLLQRLIKYVTMRQLVHYDFSGSGSSGKAWIDTSNTGIRTLMSLQQHTGRYMIWDAGQRLSGWPEIVEMVHEQWSTD